MHILLADDHGLFRDSMAVWLKQLDNALTFDFADTFQAVEKLLSQSQTYKLVMLDLGMPGMQGILSIKTVCELAGDAPVLIVSADESGTAIQAAMKAGAAGYVTKSSSGERILDAARSVINGMVYFPKEMAKLGFGLEQFNEKQQQLLGLLAKGSSNKEIAETMFLSEGTVKQYVSQVFRLLNVDNRAQAGLKAREMLRIGTS